MNTTSDKEAHDLCLVPAQKAGVLETILDSLDKGKAIPAGQDGEMEEIDLDYADHAVTALCTVVQKCGVQSFDDEKGGQREQLRELVRRTEGNRGLVDLSQADWEEFKKAVMA